MLAGVAADRWYRCFSVVVIACYLALTTLYMLAVPTGESPDEPSHLQCIEQVSLYNRIPVIEPLPQGTVWWARERIISGLVCGHMPLYYFLAGYTQKLAHLVSGAAMHYEFPPNNPLWATGGSVAMFAHPPRAVPLVLQEPAQLTLLRIESILLGLVSIFAAGRLARRLVPQSPDAALMAMILVAGWPQFLFMSRAINNDGLAVALSAGVLITLMAVERPRRYVIASLLAALAVLAKLTMVFAIAAVACFWLVEIGLNNDRAARKGLLRAGFASLLVWAGLAALLWLQPTLHNHLLWSQETMRSTHPQVLTGSYWLSVLKVTLQSGWGRFGWMNLAAPDLHVGVWWGALFFTSIIGGYAQLRHFRNPNARLILLLSCVWIVCVSASYLRIQINRFQPQFRYAFAVLPVLTALSGAGWATLLGASPRRRGSAQVILLCVVVGANLWMIFGLLAPAYR